MRVRLIQPPLVQPLYRQLTLPVVGALLAAEGFEVETCDENVQALDLSRADLVGITCHVYNAPRAFALARQFRALGIPVVLGGTFPTVAPELCLPHADSVVVGELEGLAGELAADARRRRLRPIYRAARPPDLAHTVKPDLGLIDSRRYLRFNFPLELSRGCRFGCRFCTARTLYREPRTRSLDDIARDLGDYDHGLVEVVDVNFLNDASFLRSALPLLAQSRASGWMGQTTVADLAADPDLPELLGRSRCRAVFVGLESITTPGLRSIHKSWSSPAAFLEVSRRLREAGVLVQAGIIVGLDGDGPGTLARTADLLEEGRVQSATITWLHYYPGTAAYQELQRQGRILTEDWSRYDGNHPVVAPRELSLEALEGELQAFLERLYAPGSIGRRAAHRGVVRHPVQLLHHLFVNGAVSSYYGDLEAGRGRGGDRLGKLVADTGSWVLDRLWGLQQSAHVHARRRG